MSFFNKNNFRFIIFAFFALSALKAEAQQGIDEQKFGKNRIQYQQFDWEFISSKNFDVYYYAWGREIAEFTLEYAEERYPHIAGLVGFQPYGKMKIFAYNSVIDLQQSNIGLRHQDFASGGQTKFVRSEIELAFTGDKNSFIKELEISISDILVFEMMYGGSLKEMLQSSYLLNLPEWFMSGVSSYIAYGWSEEMDDYTRDFFKHHPNPRIKNMEGDEARFIGQSIWNFLAEKYGEGSISNILNLTRIVRSEEKSIRNTLGIRYKTFLEEWEAFYTGQTDKIAPNLNYPDKNTKLLGNNGKFVFNKVRLSPDGGKLAFSENNKGRYTVKIQDLSTKKTWTTLKGGYQVINQQFDGNVPLICWKDDNTLAIFSFSKGKNYLSFFDLKTKKTEKIRFERFGHIQDFDISDDGRFVLMSAEIKGQSDIFVYDLNNKRNTQITNDPYDDLTPSFVPNSKKILFSSNRETDSLNFDPKTKVKITDRFHIYMFEKEKPVLNRLSNTFSRDLSPVGIDENTSLFLSDVSGISQLYSHNLKDSTRIQVSKFFTGIKEYDSKNGVLAYVLLQNGQDYIFVDKTQNYSQSAFTQPTVRKQTLDLRVFKSMQAEKEKERIKKELLEKQQNSNDKGKSNEPATKDGKEDYQFDSFEKTPGKKLSKKVNKPGDENGQTISEGGEYENRFTTDNFQSSAMIDPLRGWGLLFNVNMTEILENHKINAGLYSPTNFSNGILFAQYEYLRGRIDYRAKFENHRLGLSGNNYSHAYKFNRFETSASYPLTLMSRFTLTGFGANTKYVNKGLSSLAFEDVDRYYGGGSLQFVYDNSVITGVNLLEGVKAKVQFEQYAGINAKAKSFSNLEVDVRYYKNLFRSLTFASRMSFGQYMGVGKKNYFMGGVLNSVVRTTDTHGLEDPLFVNHHEQDKSDIMLSRFATNLRGFNFNKMNGPKHLIFNAEMRLPVAKFFYNGTVSSNFIRNLQFVGFFDAGTAWAGGTPFSKNNSLNTYVIESGSFSATVSNYRNPFLMSYGFGARSFILGYYAKLDVAFGIEDETSLAPKFHLSLGHDF